MADTEGPLNPMRATEYFPQPDASMTNVLMTNRTMGKIRHAQSQAERIAKRELGDVFDFDDKISEKQDLRAKIYAILSKVGFEGHEALTITERQHMELVKLYPDCRLLETWLNVHSKIETMGLNLIDDDVELLAQSTEEQRTRSQWIQNVQEQLSEEKHAEELSLLNRFFDDIRSRARASGAPDLPSGSTELIQT